MAKKQTSSKKKKPDQFAAPVAMDAQATQPPGTLNGSPERSIPKLVGKESVPILHSVQEMQRSFIQLVSGALVNSDIAFRRDRRYQKNMRRDPDVMAPLLQRQYAVALLEYNVVAEDEKDTKQVEQAEELKRLVEYNMRRYYDFIRTLSDAVWYGPSAVNIIYRRGGRGEIFPTRWKPFHPDSLVFDHVGVLGMRVGQRFKGETTMGHDSRIHYFDRRERGAIALHTFMPVAPDFDEPEEARFIYSGRGLRDMCYYTWKVKMVIQQLWVRYAERFAQGTRVGTYPSSDESARAAMETIMDNWAGDVSALIPRIQGDADAYSLTLIESKEGRAKTFADLVEGYLAGQLKDMILGQTATTEATNESLGGTGAGVSKRHAETKNDIIQFDAKILEDSLTWDLLSPLNMMNNGVTPYRPRWQFSIEDVDVDQWMKGVGEFVNMGGTVPERQVRDRLGVDEAEEGEKILMQTFDNFGVGIGSDGGRPSFDFKKLHEKKQQFLKIMRSDTKK